jgi:DNA polymerase-3 subunit delta'
MTAPAPRENPNLIGHEAAERSLEAALSGGRLHHAWLITGPEGTGKATLAYRFARRLLAGGTGGLAIAPDHPVFHRVAAATHADLFTVEREWDDKKKRLKKNIAALDARQIPPFLHLTPAEGGWRVVIVDGAEDLNPHSANALLKILEEPPQRAVLMLVCAAPGRLLPTLRSRCRHLALTPLADTDLARAIGLYLPGLDPAGRTGLIALSQGSPGRALALAEQGGLAISGLVAEILAGLPESGLQRAYEIADQLREEAAFDLFFGVLRAGISAAVAAGLRGMADPVQARLAALRSPAAWGEIWSALTRLHDETGRFNLDRRQAVVAGLALLR